MLDLSPAEITQQIWDRNPDRPFPFAELNDGEQVACRTIIGPLIPLLTYLADAVDVP